jgi:hypothetical protein
MESFIDNPSTLINLLTTQVATDEGTFKEESNYNIMKEKDVQKFIDMRMTGE